MAEVWLDLPLTLPNFKLTDTGLTVSTLVLTENWLDPHGHIGARGLNNK